MDLTFHFSIHDPLMLAFEIKRPSYKDAYSNFCDLHDYIQLHNRLSKLKAITRRNDGFLSFQSMAGSIAMAPLISGATGIVLCAILLSLHKSATMTDEMAYGLIASLCAFVVGFFCFIMTRYYVMWKISKFKEELGQILSEFATKHSRMVLRPTVIIDKTRCYQNSISSFSVNILASTIRTDYETVSWDSSLGQTSEISTK